MKITDVPPTENRDCQGLPVVLIPFSAYELVNIASVLGAIFPDRIGIGYKKSELLRCFNTGDWVALTEEFKRICDYYCSDTRPNRTPEEYIDAININEEK